MVSTKLLINISIFLDRCAAFQHILKLLLNFWPTKEKKLGVPGLIRKVMLVKITTFKIYIKIKFSYLVITY